MSRAFEPTGETAAKENAARGMSRRAMAATVVAPLLLPLGVLCALLSRYWVNVPLLDDWEMAPLIIKARQGGLMFADFFAQNEESRNVIPKFLFVLFTAAGRWDVRVEMTSAVIFCCVTVGLLLVLLRRSGFKPVSLGIALFAMALLIFSLAQHEVWLLASGFYSFLPALCIVGGLEAAGSSFSTAAAFTVCALLAAISSFTLPHGLLAWGLTFPVVFLQRSLRDWKKWSAGWALVIALCAVAYFAGYHKPTDLPPFAPETSLLDYVHYVLGFLGSAFGRSGNRAPLLVATLAGGALLLTYVAVFIHGARHVRDPELRAQVAPWLALGLYSIASAFLAALGRIGWGVPQALESRYVPFAIYLPVALIALVPIVLRHSAGRRSALSQNILVGVAVMLAAALLVLHVICSAASVSWFRKRSAATRLGHSAVLFSQVVDTSGTVKNMMYPRPDFLRTQADALDKLGLLKPALFRTANVMTLRHGVADGQVVAGWVDGIIANGTDSYTAWGWSAFKATARPADCIVLAYSRTPEEAVAFAISDTFEERLDVAAERRGAVQILSGWRATFPRSLVPAGATVSAWALDAHERRLFRLSENNANFHL